MELQAMNEFLIDYHDFVGTNPEKMFKSTLVQGDHLMLGLNCLETGQEHPLHTHPEQDKFYFVLDGKGEFTVGSQVFSAEKETLIWAAAGIPHGVRNMGESRLVLLMGMAPGPNK
jgi:quercetin dioxygenase-like cupin family protein